MPSTAPSTANDFRFSAGRARDRLQVQRYLAVDDGAGGRTRQVTTFATIRGYVRPLRGSESYIAQQKKLTVTCAIEVRYLTGLLSSDWFIDDNGIIYAIKSIVDVQNRHRKFVCYCDSRLDLTI